MSTPQLQTILLNLLAIRSPTGMTEASSAYVCNLLKEWGVDHTVNRRGTITARVLGAKPQNAVAFVAHLDTLGLVVKKLKDNGRLAVQQIGYFAPRMIEGIRVTIHSDSGTFRGTVLPCKASIHVHTEEIVTAQASSWENLEIRVDENVISKQDLVATGIDVGDIISFDTNAEITPSGFIVSRFLDNMAGSAVLLHGIHQLLGQGRKPPRDIYFIFTVDEEVSGSGARFMPPEVNEVIAVDCSPVDIEEQASSEFACTIGIKDYEMVYDRVLINRLTALCKKHGIKYRRDVFTNLSTDAANVMHNGHDVLTGYLGFGVDSTHAYERTHLNSLTHLHNAIMAYANEKPKS